MPWESAPALRPGDGVRADGRFEGCVGSLLISEFMFISLRLLKNISAALELIFLCTVRTLDDNKVFNYGGIKSQHSAVPGLGYNLSRRTFLEKLIAQYEYIILFSFFPQVWPSRILP